MTVNYWSVVGLVSDFIGVLGLAIIPERWGYPGISRRILIGGARAAVRVSWILVALGFALQLLGQFT